MARSHFLQCVVFILAIFVGAAPGCGKKPAPDDEIVDFGGGKKGDSKKVVVKTIFKADAFDGVIKGQVTFKGELPKPGSPKGLNEHNDCKTGGTQKERIEQAWLVDPSTKAVENVVVFLTIPKDKYFELSKADKDRLSTDTAIIDQPHCAFQPHVQAIFPEYYDGKKYQPTGQKFVVKNSASFIHNFNFEGNINEKANLPIPPSTEKPLAFRHEPKGDIIKVSCNIHTWMYGRVFTFDHPFYFVTKADGKFEIKGVPTGVPVTIKAWHEAGRFDGGYEAGKEMTFKKGDNTLNLEVSPK